MFINYNLFLIVPYYTGPIIFCQYIEAKKLTKWYNKKLIEIEGAHTMDKLYTIKETLDILRISRTTLYRLIDKGELTPVKISKKVLFTEEEINKFIENIKSESKTKET